MTDDYYITINLRGGQTIAFKVPPNEYFAVMEKLTSAYAKNPIIITLHDETIMIEADAIDSIQAKEPRKRW